MSRRNSFRPSRPIPTTGSWVVRPATPSDAAAVSALSGELGYETSGAEAARRLARIGGRAGHAVFVGNSGAGGVIGWVHVFAAWRVETAPFAELGGLVVSEACRGRGVGRLLVEAAEGWARAGPGPAAGALERGARGSASLLPGSRVRGAEVASGVGEGARQRMRRDGELRPSWVSRGLAARPSRAVAACWLGAALAVAASTAAGPRPVEWSVLEPGMELAEVRAARSSRVGDSTITLLRIDPERWQLEVLAISRTGATSGRTAREWSREHDLVAATNAGMFATDHSTHVGYLRIDDHLNNGRFNRYQSVAAFGRRTATVPRFRIFDLDAPGVRTEDILRDYATVMQNLRLIKRPGENRWSQQEKAWSEAALGEDQAGRILFIFCRSPFSMRDLNHELLALDVGLVAAQHLEGGPEAQLYVEAGGREIEKVGSYETLFLEDDSNLGAWRVPNVLGVRRRGSEQAARGGDLRGPAGPPGRPPGRAGRRR